VAAGASVPEERGAGVLARGDVQSHTTSFGRHFDAGRQLRQDCGHYRKVAEGIQHFGAFGRSPDSEQGHVADVWRKSTQAAERQNVFGGKTGALDLAHHHRRKQMRPAQWHSRSVQAQSIVH
jgi:hypothetical protein